MALLYLVLFVLKRELADIRFSPTWRRAKESFRQAISFGLAYSALATSDEMSAY